MKIDEIQISTDEGVILVYDGECPICSFSAKVLKLRQNVGDLQLINARQPHPILSEIQKAGLNLDEGIVLKYQGVLYYGRDALHMLAILGSDNDIFNKVNRFLFKSKVLAKILYPFLKSMRNLLLWVNKIPPIHREQIPLFKPIFNEQWELLPLVFQKHYANDRFSNDSVRINGVIDVSYSTLFGVFAPIFKLMGILIPFKGKAIPIIVNLTSKIDSDHLHFNRNINTKENIPYHFNTYMMPLKDKTIIEMTNIGLGLKIKVFLDDQNITYQHMGYAIKLGGLIIPVPIGFLLGKVFTEKQAISENEFTLKMQIKHWLFGFVYEYSGKFKL